MRKMFIIYIFGLYKSVKSSYRSDFPDRIYKSPCCKFIESTNMHEYKMPYINSYSRVEFHYSSWVIGQMKSTRDGAERLALKNGKPMYHRIDGNSHFWRQTGKYFYLNKAMHYWLRGSLLGSTEDKWDRGWMIGRYQCFKGRLVRIFLLDYSMSHTLCLISCVL